MFFKLFTRQVRPSKLPVRQLRLPQVVAAHERHHSMIFMQTMTSQVLYAQTEDGHTPAWKEHRPDTTKGIWGSFVAGLSTIIAWALSTITRRNSLHSFGDEETTPRPQSSNMGEDLIRRALEEARTKRVRFDEEKHEEVYPDQIQRHESLVELSPRSVGSADWTAAARGAQSSSRIEVLRPPTAH
ncbi:hypothetical protein BN14_09760 [Rhizoctonia solani AG-1 IB]|uniref:Uncharacterized protein n=1 Tax=Thanatephorus cucumeris (strain AG1-IB / isolate 7/3/14) TaxID=1108050 RepID=M5CG78_THACB|nr:hypothetical protein BN14_09760 [Rhizoctonia solani AG-1 IB]